MALVARKAPVMRLGGQQVRGMATEKQILMRITATSNIAKITKSMKMVSAAKMRGAEQRMNAGRPFAAWMDNLGGAPRVVEKDGILPAEELNGENAFVLISTDRGLCGGINSGLSKVVRRQFGHEPATTLQLFVVGEKGRAQLRREYSDSIRGSITEAYKSPPNFAVASAIAEAVLASSQSDAEKCHLVFNKFVSAIAYQPSIRTLTLNSATKVLDEYELEPDNKEELLADLREFELASGIYHAIVENATSEESSRMAAMENATSNATDLISSLTLKYNKARQARITTELIEIISGASSLEG